MSRLWSRFGVRTVAVALLVVGVVGGLYIGTDRDSQPSQQMVTDVAAHAAAAEHRMIADQKAAAQERARKEAAAMAAAEAKVAAERARRAEQEASRRRAQRTQSTPTPTPKFGPIPASCGEYSDNRAIGCALLLDYGYKLDQMPCLDKLWTRESGWNTRSSNSSTGAYGIPQALPGSKMASVADDWRTNPATQIKWGLNYIKGRYGSPCDAWQHFLSSGWY
ncbi:MAG TPA: lytic transglycosylase domain-containing protein [Micromonosporaceae bacterium]